MPDRRSQLESISKLRVAHRDAQRLQLADALRAEAELERQRAGIVNEATDVAKSQRSLLSGDKLNVNALLDLERYELVLRAQATAISRQLEAVEAESARRRQVLAEAEQQVRIIEKLQDKRKREDAMSEARKEQRLLDETAVARFSPTST